MTYAERNRAEYDRIMRESAERAAKRRAMTDAECIAENQRIQDECMQKHATRVRREREPIGTQGGAW